MTRNNADFQGYGVHFAPKSSRSSIAKQGLIPGLGNPDEDEPGGVYVYDTKWDAEHVGEGGYRLHDIYRVHVPTSQMKWDRQLSSADGSYSEQPIPASLVHRIGHTTAEGNIHWHKEEDCPNG